MDIVKRIINHVRLAATSKALVIGAFTVVAGGALAFSIAGGASAEAAKCNESNDIINCGAHSVSEFVSKYNANEAGDLAAIYAHYGLSSDEISRFGATAKVGTAYKDGRVEVDGQIVATDAESLGRSTLGGLNNVPVEIGGKTYHSSKNSRNFGSDSIPVLVMMNDDTHEMEFAALTVCGNPLTGKSPKYKCDALQKEQIDRTTYKFSTKTVAQNGATVSKVVYEFGDGTTETRTNPSEAVTHKYAQAGNFTAKVTVYFNVNGKEVTDTRKSCETPVEVKAEAQFECTAVTAKLITRNEYEFTAHTTASGGATLVGASFNYGDGKTDENVAPSTDATKVVTKHAYDKEGDYTITATVQFKNEGQVTSKTCEIAISVSPEACPLNPSLPKGHPDCAPCEYNPELPKGHPDCKEKTVKPPVEIPKTGPADFIGGALGLGSMTAAGTYYFRSRRNLIDRLLNK